MGIKEDKANILSLIQIYESSYGELEALWLIVEAEEMVKDAVEKQREATS
jgi:hypothetical protein